MQADPKRVLTWVLAVAMPIATAVVLTGYLTLLPYELMLELTKRNFAAMVGLPVAAVFAVFLVVVLQQTSGPIKFEGLGFKFEGTSGQVVLWILCFLAMAGAIKLLWAPSGA
jgi:hypothetical protein